MKTALRLLRLGLIGAFATFIIGVIGTGATYLYIAPQLPPIESLKEVRLQVPLRVFTRDGGLIAEFGEKRRSPLALSEIPRPMINAFLAAEDDRFFQHPGVDYHGIVRAALQLIATGEKRQGGSTITMQVARNFFLSSEKTFLRKIKEIFLALKIERELSKEEILELYLNKIYLGSRAYGVGAAAQVYYGVKTGDLSLAQVAMIAGLPKAPSRYNPIADPERATQRRNYVLGRMRSLGHISEEEYQHASNQIDDARSHGLVVEASAAYVAEMVRAEMVARYGEDAYVSGYRVITTLDPVEQKAAVSALRESLLEYDRRQGYRGAERKLTWEGESNEAGWDQILNETPVLGELVPAIVVGVEGKSASVYLGNRTYAELGWSGIEWAHPKAGRRAKDDATLSAAEVLSPGDVIRLQRTGDTWVLASIPEVEGALIAIAPRDGAITALVGGFDFARSKFNRAVQAERQPGSSLKPFIYSAALAEGYTAASIFNDAPVVVDDPALETTWRPENYSGRFYGPTRLREALVNSRNLVSIRVLQSIGVGPAIRHLQKFGLPVDRLPRDLSLALGSATVTPLELATAYTVFANGGYKIEPFFIQRIEDMDGNPLFEADPPIVCEECEARRAATDSQAPQPLPPSAAPEAAAEADQPRLAPRVLDAQNAYLMYTMMRDVIRRGTGRRALALGRSDIAGKTGTTNDQHDAWFSGFNAHRVAIAWVGYDNVRSLGERETGSRAALPIWIRFMERALANTPEAVLEQPPGLISARIDAETGLLARANAPNAVFELFSEGQLPERAPETVTTTQHSDTPQRTPQREVSEQLF
ncbi:MAG: penicillin-binding protein 1A [Proteobacteria bacterium]|nr:MAG: penicillin-binding protein 1A [Pseudomonadota bacterium]QKK10900.1 MAG: penicillin-binding protein 1A [Pseudomonadota bacterium]